MRSSLPWIHQLVKNKEKLKSIFHSFDSNDHLFRVIFPLAYLIYVTSALSEVGFGARQTALLSASPCYNP